MFQNKLTNLMLLLCVFVVSILFSSVIFADDTTIHGLGGTFPYPLYDKWIKVYQTLTGTNLEYKAVGSAEGVKLIIAKKIDFGASDKPLNPDELQKNGLMQFPMVIGGIVPIINLPNIKPGQLKLSRSVFADIYLGKIKKWNDPAIVALNPGLTLPDLDIQIVHRSDGSGTTYVLAYYLSQISAEWKNKVGADTIISWPVPGIGVTSNQEISINVSHTIGAIGCTEYTFAQNLNFISLENQADKYIIPSPASFSAAAKNADWQHSTNFSKILTDQPGNDSWPITSATFILLHITQDDPKKALALLKFFDWCFRSAGQIASELYYVPLPDKLIQQVEQSWQDNIKDTKGKPVWKN